MKKDLITAALYAGNSIGIRINAWEFNRKVKKTNAAILELFKPFIEIGVDMLEMAHETTMEAPEGIIIAVFEQFAHDWCEAMNSTGKLVKKADALNMLRAVIMSKYEDAISRDAMESLTARLNKMGSGEDDDE